MLYFQAFASSSISQLTYSIFGSSKSDEHRSVQNDVKNLRVPIAQPSPSELPLGHDPVHHIYPLITNLWASICSYRNRENSDAHKV
jgi:hypothetical protein